MVESDSQPEINPETVELARDIISEFGFGDYVDAVVEYGDQRLTVAEGLARHWNEASQLDGKELFEKVASYVALAEQQANQ